MLTTGNKSEMAVGYATLYGDMAGGLAVIKDVLKTWVYRLVSDRNERAGSELVPASVLERAPTAELRPGQRDEDSLPPYELLDRILEAYVEGDQGREQMVAAGLPEDVVAEVIRLVDRPSTSAARRRRRPRLQQGLRPRPPPADHEPFHRPREAASSAPGEPRWSSATGRRGGPRRRSARRPRSRLCCRDGGRSRPR